jgi:hypothetical protein
MGITGFLNVRVPDTWPGFMKVLAGIPILIRTVEVAVYR